MATDFKAAADAVLNRVVTSEPRVPGVVAMVTDPQRNIYEGAAGKRRLDRDADMTTDTVFAIFSTTKAITGTAALQLVEEGKLDLDAPAKTYVPEIGELKVIEGFDAHGEPKLRAPEARRHHPHAAAAHGRPGLRFLQRALQPARAGEGPTERYHRVESVADDAAAVRSGR